ncbi:MAG: fimbrial biogenesis outer membrane usher protein [Alphaproteobacteria bacterium]|nr:fimbrial biogenesis outer membrane usher protein [Alphaproteobacteria bacterium]OJV45690.1 MAG: hypothetical protein BGO28_02415 [Alphaproteobacteria bacterium 43-37]
MNQISSRSFVSSLLSGACLFLCLDDSLAKAEESILALSEEPQELGLSGAALQEKEIFDKVFGQKKSGRKQINRKIIVPVMIAGRTIGQAAALVGAQGDEVRFDWKSLKKTLEAHVLLEHLTSVDSKRDQLGYVTESSFADLGWAVHFDDSTISLVAELPNEFRKVQDTAIRSRRPQPIGRKIEPSTVSAVLNLGAAQDYTYGLAQNNGRQPSVFNMRGATNVSSLVLEGDLNYYEKAKRRWVRNDVRLVKDIESKAIRMSLGDVNYGVSGLQAAPQIGGFSFSKNFSIRPYDIIQSSGSASFTLNSESKVEFYVNSQLVDTRDLPPGPHRLTDFPVSAGANDIVLRIKDKFGQVQEIKIPFFYASSLLAEKVHSFSYNVGYLTENKLGVRHYDTKVPVFSAFHKYGLTSMTTVGLNAQGSKKQGQLGAEMTCATALGNFYLLGAASQTKDPLVSESRRKSGYSSTLQYDRTLSQDERARSFAAQWSSYTQSFTRLGSLTPSNPVSHRFSARYSQEVYGGIFGSMSGGYGIYRQTKSKENDQNLGLSKTYSDGITLTMDVARSKRPETKVEQRLMFGFRWSIPGSGHAVSADYQSLENVKRVRWNYSAAGGVGGFNAGAGVIQQQGRRGADGNLTYTGNRFIAGVSHDRMDPKEGKTLDRTTFNANTALVFADGHMALSRPVSDSFVIVAPHKTISDKKLKINPTGERYSTQTDFLGSAVLPDVSGYNINTVSIDRSEIPVGYQIEDDAYYFEPTYKRGGVAKIGTDAVVMVKGQLLDVAKNPLALASGEILYLDEPEKEPVLFFTNRSGFFAVEGLKPGKYKIMVYGDKIFSSFVSIPEGTTGLYSLDVMQTEVLLEDQKMLKEDIEE